MKSARDSLFAEVKARLVFSQEIADALKERYIFGAAARGCLVERGDVHMYVQGRIGVPALDTRFCRRVNLVARAGGARCVLLNGRALFRDMRLRDSTLEGALETSRELAKRDRYRGPSAKSEVVPRPETPAQWEALLASEGMPAELPLIRRHESLGNFSPDEGDAEAEAMPRPLRVTFDAPSARAEIADAYQAKIARALEVIRLEADVLTYRGEGLSLRKIGARLHLDKMAVLRILRRRLGAAALNNETEE